MAAHNWLSDFASDSGLPFLSGFPSASNLPCFSFFPSSAGCPSCAGCLSSSGCPSFWSSHSYSDFPSTSGFSFSSDFPSFSGSTSSSGFPSLSNFSSFSLQFFHVEMSPPFPVLGDEGGRDKEETRETEGLGGRQVWTALASHLRQWSPDLAQPSVPSAYPLPHHSSCTDSQPFRGRPCHLVPSFSVVGRVYIISGGGMGSGALKCCPSCAPQPHACPVPSHFSLTCRDSGQVSPPFLALQSVGNRHADLQTDRRQRGTAQSMGWGPFPESGPSSSSNFSPTSPASQPLLLFRPQAPDQDAFQTILGPCVFLLCKQPAASLPLYVRSIISSWAQSVKGNYFQNLSKFHHRTAGAHPPPPQFQAQKWVEGTEEGR